jgi:hypothetical protein
VGNVLLQRQIPEHSEHGQRWNRSRAGQQQCSRNGLRRARDQIGDDEDPAAVETVGDDAAEQHQHDLRDAA